MRAEERKYRDQISGTAAPSSFEIKGKKAHYVTFSGLSILGPIHGGLLVLYDLGAAAPNPACTGHTTIRIPILLSSSTRAMTLLDGQIFMRDDVTSALFCLDPATGAFTMSLKGTFVGGMGKLAGATGAYEYKGSNQVLLQDDFGAPFGGFSLETEGTLILPDRR